MTDRLERYCITVLIRLFGSALFLVAPMRLVFTICDDIAQIDAEYRLQARRQWIARELVN